MKTKVPREQSASAAFDFDIITITPIRVIGFDIIIRCTGISSPKKDGIKLLNNENSCHTDTTLFITCCGISVPMAGHSIAFELITTQTSFTHFKCTRNIRLCFWNWVRVYPKSVKIDPAISNRRRLTQ